MESLLFGMLLILGVWFFYCILSLVANFFFFGKIGEKRFLGFIPFVNDFILFRHFWNVKIYFIFLAADILFSFHPMLVSESFSQNLYFISSAIVFVINILLMDKIRNRFGKGIGYLFGLIFLYPIFLIILARRGTMTEEVEAIQDKEAGEC